MSERERERERGERERERVCVFKRSSASQMINTKTVE